MHSKVLVTFAILTAVATAQSGTTLGGDCEPAGVPCAQGPTKTVERLTGPMNGKNGNFSLSRTPAERSHVALFKNGLELEENGDYSVIDRQIILRSSNIPKPGDVLNAVYLPASLMELKVATDVKRTTAPIRGGDITEIVMREAIGQEFKAIAGLRTSKDSGGRARSLNVIEGRSETSHDRSAPNAGFDGLGDQSTVSRKSGGVGGSSADIAPSDGSRALEMLAENSRRDVNKAVAKTPRSQTYHSRKERNNE